MIYNEEDIWKDPAEPGLSSLIDGIGTPRCV
jgi:hypothetical protein